MVKIKIYFLLLIIFSCQNIFSQNILERVSFKTGYSLSVTQWGLSPFSETRRWNDRSIQSIFFNLQYLQPINKYSVITIGVQTIQKGFRNSIAVSVPGTFQFSQEYQYQLNYIEMPINYIRKINNYSLIGGVIISYMYEHSYRFKEDDILFRQGSSPVYYRSNYSTAFAYSDRFNKWDLGMNLGVSGKLYKNVELEITVQKHFINVDNWNTKDIKYNLSILGGVRYYFLSSK